jgi:hypothetical protein
MLLPCCCRTWLSGPRYLALTIDGHRLTVVDWRSVMIEHNPSVPASPRCCNWLSGPGFQDLSILRSSYLFLVTFLCVHRHFSFSRHFSLRSLSLFFFPSLFSASSGHRQTHATSDFILWQ